MQRAPATAAPRVFVDIGAHDGSSIAMAVEGGYAFDRLISVEPDPDMVAHLEKRFEAEVASGRYRVAPVGLSDRIGTARLFGDNSGGGASIVAGKFAPEDRTSREIALIDWPALLDQYGLRGARLWVKINAEGAEVPIVESILAEGGSGIESLVVDFDIVKSPFGAWAKWRTLRALRASGIPFRLAEEVFVKHGPRPRLHNWFSSFADLRDPPIPPRPAPLSKLIRMHYLDACSAIGIRLDMFKRRK
ncbi:MAG: FkbM family methyltransferase [Hyphomonadaceae bacterium]